MFLLNTRQMFILGFFMVSLVLGQSKPQNSTFVVLSKNNYCNITFVLSHQTYEKIFVACQLLENNEHSMKDVDQCMEKCCGDIIEENMTIDRYLYKAKDQGISFIQILVGMIILLLLIPLFACIWIKRVAFLNKNLQSMELQMLQPHEKQHITKSKHSIEWMHPANNQIVTLLQSTTTNRTETESPKETKSCSICKLQVLRQEIEILSNKRCFHRKCFKEYFLLEKSQLSADVFIHLKIFCFKCSNMYMIIKHSQLRKKSGLYLKSYCKICEAELIKTSNIFNDLSLQSNAEMAA